MLKTLKRYRSISLFTFSSVFMNMSSMVTGLITFHWIDPYHMGLWQSLALLQTYALFLRLGVINGMNRELPYYMGQGNVERATKYVEVTLFYTLLNIAVFVLFALGALFFIRIDANNLLPLSGIFIIVALNFYNSYLTSTFRANADFDRLSYIQIFQGGLRIISILLVVFYGFNGFILREILITAIITVVTHFARPLKAIVPRFEKQIFIDLIKVGLPIFAGSYVLLFLNTIPRLILLKYGSVSLVGIYAPLYAIIVAINVLPDSISTYLYPKMTHAIGATNDRLAVWKKAWITHVGIIVMGIPIVLICLVAFPEFIDHFIPKYHESKSILNVGIFIALFLSYKFGYTTLITLKEWKLIIIYIVSFAILQIAAPIILFAFMSVLDAVVMGQLIASALMVCISLLTNYIATHRVNPASLRG